MIERIAQASDEREAESFDRIRAAFIREASRHMDQGHGIAAVERDPDNYFWHLLELSVLAERDGHPPPHPWFAAFCRHMLAQGPPEAPSLN